jgi:membrane protease YdiL (CAAX protease family)
MKELLHSNLFQIGILFATLTAIYVVCTIRKLPIRETLGLNAVPAKRVLLWVAAYIPIFVAGEILYYKLGQPDGNVWTYEGFDTVLRIVKIALLGPIVEELVFRGMLFNRIMVSKPGPVWAVVITSVVFAASHYEYSIFSMSLILVDAVFWGMARWKTNSILIPVMLHILVNGTSVLESFFVNG